MVIGASSLKSIMFVHSSDEGYGSDRVLSMMVREAIAAGFSVLVLLPDDTDEGWLSRTLDELNVPVRKGPLAPARRRYLTRRCLPGYIQALVRSRRFLIDEWNATRPVVVHVNGSALPAAAFLSWRARGRILWHVHELVVSPVGLSVVLRLVPLLAASRVVAISDAVADHLRSLRVRSGRVVRIYNGVAPRTSSNGAAEDEHKGTTAVFIGRLSRWKGCEVFIRAVTIASQQGSDLSGIIVGSAPAGEEGRVDTLRQMIAEAGELGTYIDYLGFVDDIASVLRPGRIVAVPSIWPEPFGLVTVEAMLAGCAVVASRHGGSVELVEHGRSGLLVTPGDPKALALALKLLSSDDRLREELGDFAKKSAEARFSVEAFGQNIVAVWNELANH